MKRYLTYLIAIVICSGCSIVSEQHYYVPDKPHTTTKNHDGYFKMIYSNLPLYDSAGRAAGTLRILISANHSRASKARYGQPIVSKSPRQTTQFLFRVHVL